MGLSDERVAKIVINCFNNYCDKFNKLYKNINKLNNNCFIRYFLNENIQLKNYDKSYNKYLSYIYKSDDKYSFCFDFDEDNNYYIFRLNFMYKNNKLEIFTLKQKKIENKYKVDKLVNKNDIIKISDLYLLEIQEINKFSNIQLKLAELCCKYINIECYYY